jgi:predicted SnoaL-like aldol condensation-catalyzing enzyme
MKAAAIAFLELAAAGNVAEAFARYVAADFRHHNPYFKSDAASLRDAMRDNAAQNPGKLFEMQRALQEGDLVAVHSRVSFGDKALVIAVVHIFRFSAGKIVELWDIGQPVPESSPNTAGMF